VEIQASGNWLGEDHVFTTAGTSPTAVTAVEVDLIAGYTGNGTSDGLRVSNAVAGTGANLQLSNTAGASELGNFGTFITSAGATAGYNVSATGMAWNSSVLNVGLLGKATITSSGTMIGVLGNASGSGQGTDLNNEATGCAPSPSEQGNGRGEPRRSCARTSDQTPDKEREIQRAEKFLATLAVRAFIGSRMKKE
jgi:hypothetical protein